jgi:hypothetical protein
MMNDAEIVIQLRLEARAGSVLTEETGAFFGDLDQDAAELLNTLPERMAVKHFTNGLVRSQVLPSLSESLRSIDTALWPLDASVAPLRYFAAVNRVEGLAPGIYELLGTGVEQKYPFTGNEGLAEMVLQPEFAGAAVILLVTGDLNRAVQYRGGHGHRNLLSRAGAACEYAWLTAVKEGLVASIFAGFLPSALKKFMRLNGYDDLQLLALAIGNAAMN